MPFCNQHIFDLNYFSIQNRDTTSFLWSYLIVSVSQENSLTVTSMGSNNSRKQSVTAGEVFDKFDQEIQRGVEESHIHSTVTVGSWNH